MHQSLRRWLRRWRFTHIQTQKERVWLELTERHHGGSQRTKNNFTRRRGVLHWLGLSFSITDCLKWIKQSVCNGGPADPCGGSSVSGSSSEGIVGRSGINGGWLLARWNVGWYEALKKEHITFDCASGRYARVPVSSRASLPKPLRQVRSQW